MSPGLGQRELQITHRGVQLHLGKSSRGMAGGKNNEHSGKSGNGEGAGRFKK